MVKKTTIGILGIFLLLCVTAAVVFANVTFIDLKKSHWAYDSIIWGVEQEVVSGYPDKQFKPERKVTEAEFLKLLVSLYEKDLGSGKEWHDVYYEKARELNWTVTGLIRKENKNSPIRRGDTAILINNALGYNAASEKDYILNLYDLGLSDGKKDKTVEGYDADGSLTRAEAITFIKRVHASEIVSEFPTEFKFIGEEEVTNPLKANPKDIEGKIAEFLESKEGFSVIDSGAVVGYANFYILEDASTRVQMFMNLETGMWIISNFQQKEQKLVEDLISYIIPSVELDLSKLENDKEIKSGGYVIARKDNSNGFSFSITKE